MAHRVAGFIAALLLILFITTQSYAFECSDSKSLIKKMIAEKHLGFLGTAIDDHANVYMFFLNMQTGEWAVLGIKENLTACVLLEGTDWQFILSQVI